MGLSPFFRHTPRPPLHSRLTMTEDKEMVAPVAGGYSNGRRRQWWWLEQVNIFPLFLLLLLGTVHYWRNSKIEGWTVPVPGIVHLFFNLLHGGCTGLAIPGTIPADLVHELGPGGPESDRPDPNLIGWSNPILPSTVGIPSTTLTLCCHIFFFIPQFLTVIK